MALEDIKNFVPVSDRLGTAGQPSEAQLRDVAGAGFEVVVNLGLLDPRYCLADEAGSVASLGLAYHHIPVDFNAPQPDDLRRFFHAMDAAKDKKVFVHCAANYRVSSFVALYGEARLGWSAEQSDAHIRRIWEPNDTWTRFIAETRQGLASGTLPGAPRRVCVFTGSSPGVRPEYRDAARALGHLLAERGMGLVYGGAHVGLMGAVADGALEAGGSVIGVIPEALVAREIAHTGLTELHVVGSMHERKAMMAELSDAFVALPGGWGTLEEFCEVLTWALLGLHAKPCALLNVGGYFDQLLAFVEHAAAEGFVRPQHRELVLVADEPVVLLERLVATLDRGGVQELRHP